MYLSKDAETIAKDEQIKHSEIDERSGIVEKYLERKLPEDWDNMELEARRLFLENPLEPGTVLKDFVCVAEIWCECLGKDRDTMTRYNTRDINDIMRGLPNWEAVSSTKNFPIYGKQKYYQRLKF